MVPELWAMLESVGLKRDSKRRGQRAGGRDKEAVRWWVRRIGKWKTQERIVGGGIRRWVRHQTNISAVSLPVRPQYFVGSLGGELILCFEYVRVERT